MMLMTALCCHDAGHRLQYRIEARSIMIWSTIPERRHRHIDDARIEMGERLVVNPQCTGAPGPQILDYDIGLRCQFVHDVDALAGAQINRDRAFLLIPSKKDETEGAKRIALDAFDLDYIC